MLSPDSTGFWVVEFEVRKFSSLCDFHHINVYHRTVCSVLEPLLTHPFYETPLEIFFLDYS